MLKQTAFLSACGLMAVMAYLSGNGILPLNLTSNQLYHSITGISLLLLVNLAGLYVSWLLLLKQMNVQSQYADKICSLLKQKNCNNVLESEVAKLWGVIG